MKIVPRLTIKPKLEIYNDKGDWRWTIKVGGKIIGASTEGYKNRTDCVKNILNLRNRINQLEESEEVK